MAVPASLKVPDDLSRALSDAVSSIVAIAEPELVILFGPWAEGGVHDGSEISIMVVADAERRPMLAVQLTDVAQRVLRPRPCSIVVVRARDWPRYSETPGFLMHDVNRNGVKLYRRPG